MFILGIESSCDETAVSLVERGRLNRVVREKVKSQIDLHKEFGGVVPEIASRSHLEVIEKLADDVIAGHGISKKKIDLIAVTSGPGLIGSLLTGLSFAKGLSLSYGIPLTGVNHILSHAESPFITYGDKIEYPLLALIVSGGHTNLMLFKSKFVFEKLSSTRDDAAGEVMDKAAKYLGLGYPGGPVLDKLYSMGDPGRFKFTIPKMSDGSNDFSFSGYKTAIIRYAEKENVIEGTEKFYDLISSFLDSITEYLMEKIIIAAKKYNVNAITVSGGVSRNSLLREKVSAFSEKSGIPSFTPHPDYCTDNATMVAWLGYEKFICFPDENYFDLYIDAFPRNTF